jgi:hypothetical protein
MSLFQQAILRRREHEAVTRIISARRASRKERKNYEAKKDWLFGYSRAVGEAAFPYAPGGETDGGWGTAKADRHQIRFESLGLVAGNRWEEGVALSIARQSDLGGGNEEGKLGPKRDVLSLRRCLMLTEAHDRLESKKRKIGFLVKEKAARYGRA